VTFVAWCEIETFDEAITLMRGQGPEARGQEERKALTAKNLRPQSIVPPGRIKRP